MDRDDHLIVDSLNVARKGIVSDRDPAVCDSKPGKTNLLVGDLDFDPEKKHDRNHEQREYERGNDQSGAGRFGSCGGQHADDGHFREKNKGNRHQDVFWLFTYFRETQEK